MRAGNRLTRLSQLHYIPRYRIQLGASVWLTGEVVLGLPTLGVVGFGVPCWCGVGWPGLGVGPAGLLVRTLGKYLDPEKRDMCGPQNPTHGVLKFPGIVLVACRRKGSRVTCDLRSSSRCVSARHLGQNIPLGVCGWELTSMATLVQFVLTTGFPGRPS